VDADADAEVVEAMEEREEGRRWEEEEGGGGVLLEEAEEEEAMAMGKSRSSRARERGREGGRRWEGREGKVESASTRTTRTLRLKKANER